MNNIAGIMMIVVSIIVPIILILAFLIMYEINLIRTRLDQVREDQTFVFKYALFRHFVSADFPDHVPHWANKEPELP